jgi:hypothetical protein
VRWLLLVILYAGQRERERARVLNVLCQPMY